MDKKDILDDQGLLAQTKTRRPPRFNPEKVNQIRDEYLNTDTNHDTLARKHHCSADLIRRILGYLGVYGKHPYKDKEED